MSAATPTKPSAGEVPAANKALFANSEPCTLITADGLHLSGQWLLPEGEPKASLVMAAAFGLPRGLYQRFLASLVEQGIACLSFDYRGIGESLTGGKASPLAGRQQAMHHWAFDIEAALAAAVERYPNLPRYYCGHSCGGQLLGLAPSAEGLDAAIFVAVSSPNWRHWLAKPSYWAVLLQYYFAIPLLNVARDYFPAKLVGLSTVNIPSGVVAEWLRWGSSKDYLFAPKFALPLQGFGRFSGRILSLSFSDDAMAPASAVKALNQRYTQAELTHRHVQVQEEGLKSVGHMGFFRPNHSENLWREATAFLLQSPVAQASQ